MEVQGQTIQEQIFRIDTANENHENMKKFVKELISKIQDQELSLKVYAARPVDTEQLIDKILAQRLLNFLKKEEIQSTK